MTADEFSILKRSIETNGVREPVVVLDGQILDGQHRWRACQELGIECPTMQFDGESAIDYVMDRNLHRRQLTPSQRAAIAAEAEPFFAEQVKNREPAPVATLPPPKARDLAAQTTGASPRLVQDAKKVMNESPELHAKVKSGEVTVTEAKREIEPATEHSDAKGADALEHTESFQTLIRQIKDIKAEVEKLAATLIGRELRSQSVCAQLDYAIGGIRIAIPHALCDCGGKKSNCAACKGMGWITQEQERRQKQEKNIREGKKQ